MVVTRQSRPIVYCGIRRGKLCYLAKKHRLFRRAPGTLARSRIRRTPRANHPQWPRRRKRVFIRNAAAIVKPPRVVGKEVQPLKPEKARRFLDSVKGNRLEAHLARQLHGLRSWVYRSGGKHFAAPRKPLRAKSVTYVLGTNCYPCVRNGQEGIGGPCRI